MDTRQYMVPFDQSFELASAPTSPNDPVPSEKKLEKKLDKLNDELYELQRKLYAQDRYAILLVFQAMDAAGKDSTIRRVMRGVNPAGCQVFSFKQPSTLELEHDFLWRSAIRLPEKGRIGIFNRSYYEEVLVVRVHPEYLAGQRVDGDPATDEFWENRMESINAHEEHLARNGTRIIKFWLNVSKEEQKQRFLARLQDPRKNWKFSSSDVRERGFWQDYMDAYEKMLKATSKPHAPWYAIPADNKPYARVCVANIVADTIRSVDPGYPRAAESEKEKFHKMERLLMSET